LGERNLENALRIALLSEEGRIDTD
jgi:hypothetical protein